MLVIFCAVFVLYSCAEQFTLKSLTCEKNLELFKRAYEKKKELISEKNKLVLRYNEAICGNLCDYGRYDYLNFVMIEDSNYMKENENTVVESDTDVENGVENIIKYIFRIPFLVKKDFIEKMNVKYNQPGDSKADYENEISNGWFKSRELSDEDTCFLIELLDNFFLKANGSMILGEAILLIFFSPKIKNSEEYLRYLN